MMEETMMMSYMTTIANMRYQYAYITKTENVDMDSLDMDVTTGIQDNVENC